MRMFQSFGSVKSNGTHTLNKPFVLLWKLSLNGPNLGFKADYFSFSAESSVSSSFRGLIRDLSKAPAPKQIFAGAACGWITGYMTMKIGKMAATAVGGSLLLLQIAHHKGYIKVDWNRMTNDSASVADRVRDKLRLKSRSGIQKFQDFAAENVYLVRNVILTAHPQQINCVLMPFIFSGWWIYWRVFSWNCIILIAVVNQFVHTLFPLKINMTRRVPYTSAKAIQARERWISGGPCCTCTLR